MDVRELKEDEVLAECEVRGLTDASKRLTEALKEALKQKLEEETGNWFAPPLQAPANVCKQPKREVQTCTNKLREFKEALLNLDPAKAPVAAELKRLNSRLVHVHGRLIRISHSAAVKKEVDQSFEAVRMLANIIQELTTGKIKSVDAAEVLADINIPTISPAQADTHKTKKKTPGAGLMSKARQDSEAVPKYRDSRVGEPSTSTGFESHLFDSEATSVLEAKKADLESQLANLSVHLMSSPTQERVRSPSEASSLSWGDDQESGFATSLPLSSRVCKDPSTWGLKFEGPNSSTHIERFFYRVERMATRSYIRLNELVDYMSLLLTGEALEWYWVYLERNQAVSWLQLKQDMITRFQMSRTDEDVRRQLNQRRQLYPRESFQEYYDAILKLTLQSRKAITDQDIYTILRRNMRPGLQLKLHDQRSFPSLSHFVQRCLDLEDLWRRFGVNPEAKVTASHTPYQQQSRYAPRVHELVKDTTVYLDDTQDEINLRCTTEPTMTKHNRSEYQPIQIVQNTPEGQDGSDFNTQCSPRICAMHNRSQSNRQITSSGKPPTGPTAPTIEAEPRVSILKHNTEAPRDLKRSCCWNCGDPDHIFSDCRMPIKRVFCFGCGMKDVYKPDCPNCTKRQGNAQGEIRSPREPHLSSTARYPRVMTEEAASNTDPELYHRRRF